MEFVFDHNVTWIVKHLNLTEYTWGSYFAEAVSLLPERGGLPFGICKVDNPMSNFLTSNIVALLLLITAVAAGAAPDVHPHKLIPGSKYYFDNFDPEQKPWNPGRDLNIEEVFKNYQYVEIVLDQDGRGITVTHFIQGGKKDTVKYLLMPDGSLSKRK